MPAWAGKRSITVITACMTAEGHPDFAITQVEVTYSEYENGLHYSLVEDQLADNSYEEPYVHFDELEAPAFLHAAVRTYLEADRNLIPFANNTKEKS